MNKRWEIGEKNKFGNECYKLYFTQFYDEEFIVGFVKNIYKDNCYIITSPMLNIGDDDIFADNIEDAKKQCEYMIEEHIQDQIDYYEDRLKKFKEV
jgi:hypothetical protein